MISRILPPLSRFLHNVGALTFLAILLMLFALFPFTAWAEAGGVAAIKGALPGFFVEYILPTLGMLLLAVAGYGAAFLKSAGESAKARAAVAKEEGKAWQRDALLGRLELLGAEAVRRVVAVTKPHLAEATSPDSPGGRKITPEEFNVMKEAALQELLEVLGTDGRAALAEALGIGADSARGWLASWVGGKLAALIEVEELEVAPTVPMASGLPAHVRP